MNDKYFVSTSVDNLIQFWDIDNLACVQSIKTEHNVNGLTFLCNN